MRTRKWYVLLTLVDDEEPQVQKFTALSGVAEAALSNLHFDDDDLRDEALASLRTLVATGQVEYPPGRMILVTHEIDVP